MSRPLKQRLILAAARTVCALLSLTYRYRLVHRQHRLQAEAMQARGAFVLASWHQNCFAAILAHSKQNIALLVSRSFDGEIVSAIADRLGLLSVRGSSRKGGAEALDVLIERTQAEGLRSAFTVDGPKGPLYKPKRGIFRLAAESGAPILPVLAIGEKNWVLHKSWDKLRIPKPFSRVAVIYGAPFSVSREELAVDLDLLTERLTRKLHDLQHEAEILGLSPSSESLGVRRDLLVFSHS